MRTPAAGCVRTWPGGASEEGGRTCTKGSLISNPLVSPGFIIIVNQRLAPLWSYTLHPNRPVYHRRQPPGPYIVILQSRRERIYARFFIFCLKTVTALATPRKPKGQSHRSKACVLTSGGCLVCAKRNDPCHRRLKEQVRHQVRPLMERNATAEPLQALTTTPVPHH